MQGIASTDRVSEPASAGATPDDAWEALAELVADGVLESEAGEVVRANARAAAMLGCEGDVDALLGRAIADLHELQGEHSVPMRTRELGRGRALHVLVANEDANDHAKPSDAVQDDSEDDLARAQAEAQSVRAAFDTLIAERQQLVAVVCHELRTPITVIRGYARLLGNEGVGTLNAEQERFVGQLVRSCERINEFVEQLLRASQAERSADEVDAVDASLLPVLEGVVEYLRPVIAESSARIDLALDPDAVWARFDPVRIEQVVANLVSNALEYAPGSTLRIHTHARTVEGVPCVEVAVSDDGPGIPEAEREKIFEPYVRGSTTVSGRGLGLGLSICRRIVEAHGGRIEVRAEPGGGSCFAFQLRAAKPGVPPTDEHGKR